MFLPSFAFARNFPSIFQTLLIFKQQQTAPLYTRASITNVAVF
jgi:hypothetical protein